MRYVFILCFSELFIVEVLSQKQQFTIFCCRGSKLTLREPLLSPCWMCLSFLANTQTRARAHPRGHFNCKASPNWHSSKNQYTIHCCRESKHSSKESKWSPLFLAQKSQNLVSTHSAQNNSLQQRCSIGKSSMKSAISPGASGTRGAGPRVFSTSPVTHTTLWEWYVEMRYVFILCFSELFIVEVSSQKQQFTIFLLQGIQAYIEGTSTQSVLDVFVFCQIRKHQHALIHACFGACGHFNCKASLNWHSRKNNSLFIAAGNPSIHARNQNGALHPLLKNRKT